MAAMPKPKSAKAADAAAKLAQELGGYDEKALRSYVMREIGRKGWSKGGQARAAKLTPERRREISTNAVKARWAKKREG